jgi:hypothetical protein
MSEPVDDVVERFRRLKPKEQADAYIEIDIIMERPARRRACQ